MNDGTKLGEIVNTHKHIMHFSSTYFLPTYVVFTTSEWALGEE